MGHLHGRDGPAPRGLTARAALTSLGLSLLFLLVYGGTNWLTSQRSDVGTWFFAWELGIPFLPVMIVPYMSIDLFFVAAPFLCREETELRTFRRRITFSIFVAGAFFLALPLRLGFERGPVAGPLGALFDAFRAMDAPHNLFPSLHITLRALLAVTYARHTRGLARAACMIWFSLIGLSTVLTHQHHLVDIAGGFVLAGFAFYLFREDEQRVPVVPNVRVAACYGMGAAGTLALAAATWPLGALLLWPAIALFIVASAYCGGGPGIFRKAQGRLPLSSRFVLGPVLLGQYLSLLYYRRQCRPWDAVSPGVLIGRKLNDAEATQALHQGVTAVLDLTGEFSEAAPFLKVHYRNLPILDLTAPTQQQMLEAAEFIAEQSEHGVVYVHCKIGYSRSAAAVGAYLILQGLATSAEQAIGILQSARPSIVVRSEVREALNQFAAGGWRSESSPNVAYVPAMASVAQ